MLQIILAVTIPLLGTTLGSAMVFFIKDKLNERLEKALLGFAGGVMMAAGIWSLIIPSLSLSESMGKLSFIPAAVGILIGIGFLFALDILVPHVHKSGVEEGNIKHEIPKTTKMMFAVTLHNIPEGMAVGVVLAGFISGQTQITIAAALALSIGIAIQNFPEGATISMPLCIEGTSKKKSFILGFISGVVEPIAALITMAFVSVIEPVLPYILSFAAGAMIYVIIEELIPDSQSGEHSNIGTIAFALGFVLMMILDITLG